MLEQEGCWAFHPKIDKTDVDKSFMGKLYRISSPVVGVFGTSPKQGKFTLQIALKKKMSEIGYRLGGLVSEPSALLFGFDFTYPMGHERSIYISGSEAVQTVNRLMHEIDKKQYGIYLTEEDYNDELQLDSLQFISLIIGIEETFSVEIDEIHYTDNTLNTFEDFLKMVV